MAEGGGLENRFTSNRDGGSNPSPSVFIFNLSAKDDKINLSSKILTFMKKKNIDVFCE